MRGNTLRINNNPTAAAANSSLNSANKAVGSSIEKLSSGLRINRSADDAAGLVISEKLRSQIGGSKVAIRNAQDGIGVVQTADGALNETTNILQRMRDLAMHAGSGAADADGRAADQAEFDALESEINRIAGSTKYGTQNLLDGSFGASPAKRSGFDANNSITHASGDDFAMNINGNGSVTIELDGNTRTGAEYAAYLQATIRAALTADNAANQAVADKVTVKSTSVGAGAAISIEVSGLAATQTFTMTDGTNTPLAGLTMTGATTAASGAGGSFVIGSSAAGNDVVNFVIESGTAGGAFDETDLGIAAVDLTTAVGGQAAVATIDAAITEVTGARADLGAMQNRFEHAINNLNNGLENLTASESRIRDTDMAAEMTQFTRAQILSQASTAMLAQANSAPQGVLQLLRG